MLYAGATTYLSQQQQKLGMNRLSLFAHFPKKTRSGNNKKRQLKTNLLLLIETQTETKMNYLLPYTYRAFLHSSNVSHMIGPDN